jgi:hypothetical protein
MTATVRTPDHDQRGPRESSHAAQPRIAFRREHGILVLRPVGTLDRRLTERLRRAVLDASRPVAVDLDTCDVEPAALDRIAVDPRLRPSGVRPRLDAARGQLTPRSWPSQYGSRSSRLSTFIAPDSGSGSRRSSTDLGTL